MSLKKGGDGSEYFAESISTGPSVFCGGFVMGTVLQKNLDWTWRA